MNVSRATGSEVNGRESQRTLNGNNFQEQHQLPATYKPTFDTWLRSFGLVTRRETHRDCLEPYVWHGYRPNPSSLIYCLKSAFHPTNETFNAWTHFLPLLFMLWRFSVVYSSLQDPLEKITHPFWIHCLGIVAVLLASSFAHLFNCHSAFGQELCFCLDYGMIPVFGLTAAICFDHYVCSFQCFALKTDYFPRIHLTIVFLFAILGTYITCLSRYPSCPFKYLYRFGPYAVCFAFGTYPCYVRYLIQKSAIVEQASIPKHCFLGENYVSTFPLHGIAFLVAILFVSTRFPERWFAGTFDIVGGSHQIFHICTAIGMYLQHSMAESALKEAIKLRDKKLLSVESLHITKWTTFAPLIAFLLFLPFPIYQTASAVGNELNAQRKIKVV